MANVTRDLHITRGWDDGGAQGDSNISVAVHKTSDNSFVMEADCNATGVATITVDDATEYWLYIFGLNIQPTAPIRLRYRVGAPEYIDLGKVLVA